MFISEKIWNLERAYVVNAIQYVSNVVRYVVVSSPLGALLFNVFVNDICTLRIKKIATPNAVQLGHPNGMFLSHNRVW